MAKNEAPPTRESPLWDCGSSLYDSFELKSFERQLDSAITRTYSMPHVADVPAPTPTTPVPKKISKISRSINKLLRSVFRTKPTSDAARLHGYGLMGDGYYGLNPDYGALATIPEACEKDVSPELRSVLGKSASERFPAAAVTAFTAARISCP